jgi:hypothetical protein
MSDETLNFQYTRNLQRNTTNYKLRYKILRFATAPCNIFNKTNIFNT